MSGSVEIPLRESDEVIEIPFAELPEGEEVLGILIDSCLDMGAAGFDSATGWGMIRADEAVRLARELACASDLDGDGNVGGPDLGLLFASWGDCDDDCPADLNDDGIVNGEDLGLLFTTWGDC